MRSRTVCDTATCGRKGIPRLKQTIARYTKDTPQYSESNFYPYGLRPNGKKMYVLYIDNKAIGLKSQAIRLPRLISGFKLKQFKFTPKSARISA